MSEALSVSGVRELFEQQSMWTIDDIRNSYPDLNMLWILGALNRLCDEGFLERIDVSKSMRAVGYMKSNKPPPNPFTEMGLIELEKKKGFLVGYFSQHVLEKYIEDNNLTVPKPEKPAI
jgi:hypothetical protein